MSTSKSMKLPWKNFTISRVTRREIGTKLQKIKIQLPAIVATIKPKSYFP